METNEKLMMLLRLMDKPEAMTDEQLEELLADDEVRNAYNLMADCKKVYKSEELRVKSEESPTGVPKGSSEGMAAANSSFLTLHFSLLKIAAVFLGAVFLCGLAWAIMPRLISSHTDSPQSAQTTTPLPQREGQGGGSPVRFDDMRLDSILTVVSAHYGKTVSYRSEEPRAMKLITTWNPDDPLTAFIDHLNMFDYLHLTLQNDTIFVESTNGEDAQ